MGAAGHNLARLYETLAPRPSIPPRLVRMIFDSGPLYLPTEYPDAAFGVPRTMFKKEQAERYPMVTQQYVQRIAQGYVEQLGRKIRVEEAILTGSWAKGSFLEDSDVHLVIVSDDFSRMSLPERLSFTPIMVFPSGEISNFDTGRKR